MYCRKCGKTVDPHAKFCSNCGAEIKDEKIEFDFDRPSKHTEPEKKKVNVTKENFKWDLDGFPSENKKTEEVNFNWDSVLDTRRREDPGFSEPVSFTEKEEEPEKKDEVTVEPVPEKYELSDLFGDDIKPSCDEEEYHESEETCEEKQDENDIMELSFEDEIFGDLKDEKPASATIRISQTIHFTDQLYSFDNKQAEYQSLLDEEYDKLQNGEDDEETEPEMPVFDEVRNFEDLESGEPEIRTGIASDDFLRELYGTTNVGTEEETEEPSEKTELEDEETIDTEEEAETAEAVSEETEEENEEVSDVQEAEEVKAAEEETEEPSFVSVDTIIKEKEEESEAGEADAETETESSEEESEEKTEIEKEQETAEEEEPEAEETEDTPEAEEAETESAEKEEEEIICEESVPADGMEYIGVALARTPRGVLVIQKNNTEKLKRRTILPSKETENTEEERNTETEKEERTDSSVFEKQPEKERNEKLSFGDVFNNTDDDDDDEDYKPKKKGKALKVIAIILFIAIICELAFIGIQHFAPDSSVAKKLNSLYSKVVEKIIPGDEPEVIEEEDFVVTSPVNDYVVAEEGKYKNIAKITTDVDLKFPETKTYDIEGFADAGAFTDGEWFRDEEGNSVFYGQAVVQSVCGFYSSLTDYRNSENEDVMDLITENSPVEKQIDEFVPGDAVYAVNSLTIGEIRTSTSGIYVAARVEEANDKADKPETKDVVIFLRAVENTLKIDNILNL